MIKKIDPGQINLKFLSESDKHTMLYTAQQVLRFPLDLRLAQITVLFA